MLIVNQQNHIQTLTLNRPEVRNAFNAELITQLTEAIAEAHQSDSVRALVLRGAGEHFSAGADLNWMLAMKNIAAEDNAADARRLAELMFALDRCRKPVLAVVHGAVMGGGVGLTACADIVIARDDASFALSETRLGLTPATISPYVVNAIGARQARRYMLSGERFDAHTAAHLGLVHEVCSAAQLESCVDQMLANLLKGAPGSQRKIKKLVRDVSERPLDETLLDNLSWRIANQRVSDEGQAGIRAFLDKKPAPWIEDKNS